MSKITMPEFLTKEQIDLCIKYKTAKLILEHVLQPNWKQIQGKIEQECHPMYLAYACEYIVSQITAKK